MHALWLTWEFISTEVHNKSSQKIPPEFAIGWKIKATGFNQLMECELDPVFCASAVQLPTSSKIINKKACKVFRYISNRFLSWNGREKHSLYVKKIHGLHEREVKPLIRQVRKRIEKKTRLMLIMMWRKGRMYDLQTHLRLT